MIWHPMQEGLRVPEPSPKSYTNILLRALPRPSHLPPFTFAALAQSVLQRGAKRRNSRQDRLERRKDSELSER